MLKRASRVNRGAAVLASLAMACLVSSTGSAQRRITSPDGHAATEIRGHYEGAEEPVYVGGKWIEISYGRPIKRGRDLWESGASYRQAAEQRGARLARRCRHLDLPDERIAARD